MFGADAVRCVRRGGGGIPLNGLIAWYTMDNITGSTLIDEMGNYNGTIYGAAPVAGVVDNALDFTPPNYIETNERFDFIHQTCSFTYNTWLNCDKYNDGGVYIFAGSALASLDRGFWLSYEDRSGSGDRSVRIDIYRGVDKSPTISLSINLAQPASGWAMVTIQGDGSTVSIYINNVLVGSGVVGLKSTSTATRTVNIGRSNHTTGILQWDGKIDETVIYNRPLSSSERQYWFDRGNI